MPCASIAAAWSGSSRTASRPPWTFGCSVFTRPSIISGNPVRSEMSSTVSPASRSALAVPPVETSSTPCLSSALPNSASPVLSETDNKARAIFTSVMSFLRSKMSGGPLELPADSHAFARRLAGDDELESRARPCFAVDPQAVLGDEPAAATAELPYCALEPQQRPLSIRGRGDLDPGREMEADGEGDRLRPAPAPGRDQPVLAGQMATVAGQVQPALVEQAVAADIAVMARPDPAARGVVAGPRPLSPPPTPPAPPL